MPEIDDYLSKIENIFLRYGIKSVTMDDISRDLGISKKTLYQFFDNKLDIVEKVLKYHLEIREESIKAVADNASDAMDEWYQIFEQNCGLMRTFNPFIVYDLQKYYPSAWDLFIEHKNRFIFKVVSENLQRGISEGLYRKNLNVNIVTRLYVSKLEVLMDRSVFPETEFERTDVLNEYVQYHLRGVASSKGLEYILTNKIFEQWAC